MLQENCPQGTPIENGAIIKLQHMATRKWLHSHNFFSPLSNNQEISCFGSNDETDTGDEWEVRLDSKEKVWHRDTKVKYVSIFNLHENIIYDSNAL